LHECHAEPPWVDPLQDSEVIGLSLTSIAADFLGVSSGISTVPGFFVRTAHERTSGASRRKACRPHGTAIRVATAAIRVDDAVAVATPVAPSERTASRMRRRLEGE
jgi:hypothetical protein